MREVLLRSLVDQGEVGIGRFNDLKQSADAFEAKINFWKNVTTSRRLKLKVPKGIASIQRGFWHRNMMSCESLVGDAILSYHLAL